MRKVLFLVIMLFSLLVPSTAKEVPFTQEDRDRLIRVEVKVEALQKQIDDLKTSTQKQIDGLQRQMDGLQKQVDELRSDLRTYMSITLGALFTIIVGIIALIGFVLWDRRTAISPVARKTRELEDRSERIERVLKSLAKRNPEIEEAMKREGLL
ncbi:MAG: coiled-coil domain-containing protein [Aquificaceae bacterium]